MTRSAGFVLVIAVVALGVATVGLAVGAHSHEPGFDELTHVLSTFAATCAVALALGRRAATDVGRRVVLFVGIGLAIGLAWEMLESTIEWVANVDIRNRPHDTATDLVCDVTGAVIAALAWPRIRGRSDPQSRETSTRRTAQRPARPDAITPLG